MNLKELLNFDGLYEAEKLTGESYKNDHVTERLGMSLVIGNARMKQKILEEQKDSNRNTTAKEMISYMEELGFTKLHSKTKEYDDRGELEKVTQYYYWHYEKYVLAVFETYPDYQNPGEYRINSGTMYYAIKAPWEKLNGVLSSGGYDSDNGVWNGDHDIREAFKYKFNSLDEAGEFVPWTKENFIWLITYAETKDKNYNSSEINAEVLSHFPEEVKQNMKWYK